MVSGSHAFDFLARSSHRQTEGATAEHKIVAQGGANDSGSEVGVNKEKEPQLSLPAENAIPTPKHVISN